VYANKMHFYYTNQLQLDNIATGNNLRLSAIT